MPVLYQGGSVTSGSVSIPELSSDPVSPAAQSAWVLKTSLIGTPIGLLLALTHSTILYQFSYRTLESTTIRVVMS